MLIQAGFAAWRQVFSPALRRVLWTSLALAVALLALAWFALSRLFDWFVSDQMARVDRSALTNIPVSDGEDREYWRSRTPAERLAHVEALRRIKYGSRAAGRMEKVIEIVDVPWV